MSEGANEEVITGRYEMKRRQNEYSEGLLNVSDDRVGYVRCLA